MKIAIPRVILLSLLAATMPLMGATPDEPASARRGAEARTPDKFRFEISTMRARIGISLAKLQLLQKEDTDLQAVFKEYRGEVAEMTKLAKQTAGRADEMKKQDRAFFRAWEARADTIQDPDIRKLAKDRYDRRMKSYRKMVASMNEAQNAFVPFLASLQDIQKLLESDLSRNSVQSAQKFFRAVRLQGADLQNELYDVLIEEGRISDEFGRYQ
jgi:hypothetical protein